MLIPSSVDENMLNISSLSRRVNANSQQTEEKVTPEIKLIKKGEC